MHRPGNRGSLLHCSFCQDVERDQVRIWRVGTHDVLVSGLSGFISVSMCSSDYTFAVTVSHPNTFRNVNLLFPLFFISKNQSRVPDYASLELMARY